MDGKTRAELPDTIEPRVEGTANDPTAPVPGSDVRAEGPILNDAISGRP